MRRLATPAAMIAGMLLPNLAGAGWEEGVAAFQAGRYQEAANEFRAVAEEQPDWPGSYLMLGRTLLKLNRANDAITTLRKGYDLEPGSDPTKMALGQAYLEAHRYGDAASLLRTVKESSLNPAQKGAYNQMLAAAMSKSGQASEAQAALRKAVQANPNDADLQQQFGAVSLSADDTASAVKAFEAAVRLDGRDNSKREALVKALIRQGRETPGSGKITAYRRAVDIASGFSGGAYEHLLLLGEAQLGAKKYSEAAQTFGRASGQKPTDWLPLYYIGQAQTANGQFGEAESNLQRALQQASDSKSQTRIWRQLAFVFEKQKRFEKAIAAYNRVGDSAGVTRVSENQRISEENQLIEEENEELQRLRQEAAAIEEQMKDLPPG